MSRLIDLTGEVFGRLTVMRRAPVVSVTVWECRCVCGVEKAVRAGDLRMGKVVSCGCWKAERARAKRKHPVALHAELEVWKGMVQRCTNPNHVGYRIYGGRGIAVCERWQGSGGFAHFIEDIGPRPSSKHSIERIDNDGNYEPGNCKWATRIEQCNNTRINRRLTYKGKTQTLIQWAREVGVNYYTLHNRTRLGWDDAKVIGTPIGRRGGYRPRQRGNA